MRSGIVLTRKFATVVLNWLENLARAAGGVLDWLENLARAAGGVLDWLENLAWAAGQGNTVYRFHQALLLGFTALLALLLCAKGHVGRARSTSGEGGAGPRH